MFFQRSRLLFGLRGANLPSEMAYCGHASEEKPKRSLEKATAGALNLGGSVVASHHKWGHGTLDTHDAPLFAVGAFFFGEADFFSVKRLFLREARDVSGVRSNPPWAREGKN